MQALGAELFYRERSHHTAIEQRTLDDFAVDLFLRRDIAHKSTGEGIARAGWVFDFINRQSRGAERMAANSECTFAKENGRAVLSVLDDQRLRPHSENLVRGTQQVLLSTSQHFGFAVVDQQNIYQPQGLTQLLARTLDPEVHGVAAGQAYAIHFFANSGLQAGMDVAEKQDL